MSLKLINLKKAFGDKLLFEGLSFDFPDTGIYLISGKSGAGKTTLLRMICALDSAYSGRIEGGGISKCSYVFQEHRLFPEISALENVMLARGGIKDESLKNEAVAILSHLGFTDEEMQLLPSELSGGMKQRVSISRALLKAAPILLLDEPTKELDAELKKKLYGIISEEAQKRLVILVSHNKEDAEALGAITIEI